MSANGEIYTAGKTFTLPPAVTAWTNSTSAFTVPTDSMKPVDTFRTVRLEVNFPKAGFRESVYSY